MNLQPLFELKERLSHAAIAGTQLLGEDFRLKRAVENLAPLAKANPVFLKIFKLAQSLLAAPEEDRAALLLDTLSLVDAVLYTQSATDFPGDLTPLSVIPGSAQSVPYSVLQPLIHALNSAGPGRGTLVQQIYEQSPVVFTDCRIRPALIRALEDNNFEIALFAMDRLREQGKSVIPMLKEGFDPQGKAAMARRLALIIQMAGEGENDWYLSILPDCGKQLKEQLIFGLSLCQDNAELLMTLSQTERGKLQEAALASLARMDHPEAVAFLREKVAKTPKLVLSLGGIWSELTAELTADALRGYFGKLLDRAKPCSSQELVLAGRFANVFAGQYGSAVREFWNWASARMDQLHKLKPEKLVLAEEYSLAQLLQKTMLLSILRNPCYGMLRLGRALGDADPEWFCGCGLLARILDPDGDAEEALALFGTFLKAPLIPMKRSAQEERQLLQILTVLSHISWDTSDGLFRITYSELHPGGNETVGTRLLRSFDPRWAIRLAEYGVRREAELMNLHQAEFQRDRNVSLDEIMMNLMDSRDGEVCRICGETLYHLVKVTGYIKPYYQAMIRCGWTQWSGLLTHVVQRNSSVNYSLFIQILAQLPMTNGEKALELRRIDELVRRGQISAIGRHWPEEHIQNLIQGFESPNG